MRYLVQIYGYKGDYSAMAPDLPGCVAVSSSVERTRKLMAEAMALHIDLMRKHGEKVPEPTQSIEFEIDGEDEEAFCTWVDVDLPKPRQSRRAPKRRKQRA